MHTLLLFAASLGSADTDFLESNAARPNVVVLPSGLQYEPIVKAAPGGLHPKVYDACVVHYVGTLIDGTVFDSSRKRGKPSVFAPNQVIQGWREALPLMTPGDRWKLYVPSQLGYGSRGKGKIPGSATLVFDTELLEVRPATSIFAAYPVMDISIAGPIKSGWVIMAGVLLMIGGLAWFAHQVFMVQGRASLAATPPSDDEDAALCHHDVPTKLRRRNGSPSSE